MRDPAISSKSIKDEMGLESQIEKLKSLEAALAKVKTPAQKKKILKNAYTTSGTLFFYFEDVKNKRIDTIKNYNQLNKRLARFKAKFKRYSRQYAQFEKNKTLKAAALYQSISQSYLDRATKGIITL